MVELIIWIFFVKHFPVRLTLEVEVVLINLSESCNSESCFLTSTFKNAIGMFFKLFFVDLMTVFLFCVELILFFLC